MGITSCCGFPSQTKASPWSNLFPWSLSSQDKTTCAQLLEKVKNVFWKGISTPGVINPLVHQGRSFIQKFSSNCKAKPVIELERYVNAIAMRAMPDFPHYHIKKAEPKAEFGITKRMAAKYPDLADFNRQHDIRSPRGLFGHTVVEEKDGEPLIHFEGNKIQWNLAKKEIFGKEMPSSFALPHGWKYIQKGVVHKDLVKWNKLEPLWKDDMPSKKGVFYLEVISKQRGFMGELRHCFLRLIDDEGNVISVGMGGTVYVWLPFRTQKAKLCSPDPWEYQEGIEYSTRFPLNEELYNKVKNRIESDQNNNELFFNIVTRNCAAYSTEILKEIGIEVDIMEFPTEMVWRKLGCHDWPIPKWCKKTILFVLTVLNYLISPIMSFVIFLLGGAYTNPNMKALQKEKGEEWTNKWKRPFTSIKSIFDGSNFYFYTGWKMTEWQRTQPSFREKNFPKNKWNAL